MMNKTRWLQMFIATVLLIVVSCHTSQAQNQESKNKPKSVLKWISSIEEKTDYNFFFNDAIEELNHEVVLEARLTDIEEVLLELKSKTKLDFKILDNNLIVVVPTENQKAIVVTGTVKSKTDNMGLPGVNVFVKGSTHGTITDVFGNYKLEVANQYDVLVYSFIGFNQIEKPINGQDKISVALSEDIESLDEVVVTALNISRNKSSLGYSITQVNSDDVSQAKENNPINSLSGKVAGLQITRAATGVDGSTRVVLRGVSSMTGNNRPLFVIDGIPMESGHGGANNRWGGTDGGDALSDLNPEDIESMSVLKGAGASALYGSRGANGVILITTKKGTQRKGIGVTVNSGYTIETPMVLPELQNDYGQGAFGRYPPLNGPHGPSQDYPNIWSYGPKIEGQNVTGWHGGQELMTKQPHPYKEFLRTGSTFTNTVAFEGGNGESTFRASITNQDAKGLVPNNDLSRQTLALRGFSKLSENLEFDAKISYVHSKVNNRPDLAEGSSNLMLSLDVLPRNISMASLRNNTVDANGKEMKWTSDHTFSNPYWVLDNLHNEDEKHRLQTMLSLKWTIVNNLSLAIRSGFDMTNSRNMGYENPGRVVSSDGLGSFYQGYNNGIEWNSDFLLSYHKKVNDNWDLTVSLGGNHQFNKYRGISQSGVEMREPGLYTISNYKKFYTGEGFSEKAIFSLYGMGQVSYRNYLYLDVTYRNDFSSTLPLENNSYSYHSENLSFLFTEALGISSHILSTGKLRASYAKVGNDTHPYKVDQYYGIGATDYSYPLGYIGGNIPNFQLKPEITHSYEVGTDLSLFNGRIGVDATYYHSISKNQIMDIAIPITSGYSSKTVNAGEIQNSGIELQLNAKAIQSGSGVNWDVILTWTKNKNKVNKLYGDMEYLPLGDDWHAEIRAYEGSSYGDIYTRDFKRDIFGNKLVDDLGYAIPGEYKKMGNINPDWMAGITNQLTYKGWTVSCLVDIQKGGDIYSWGKAYRTLFGTGVETLEGRAEWYAGTGGYVEEGINENNLQPNTVPISPTARWYHIFNKQIGAEWMQDATNVRLREVVIGYSLPQNWLNGLRINKVHLSLVGRNLFFIYKAMDHVDPESGFGSGNVSTGFEHSALPSTRSIGANLKINF